MILRRFMSTDRVIIPKEVGTVARSLFSPRISMRNANHSITFSIFIWNRLLPTLPGVARRSGTIWKDMQIDFILRHWRKLILIFSVMQSTSTLLHASIKMIIHVGQDLMP